MPPIDHLGKARQEHPRSRFLVVVDACRRLPGRHAAGKAQPTQDSVHPVLPLRLVGRKCREDSCCENCCIWLKPWHVSCYLQKG